MNQSLSSLVVAFMLTAGFLGAQSFEFAVDSFSVDGNLLGKGNSDGAPDFLDDFNDGSITTAPTSAFGCVAGDIPTESGGFLLLRSADARNNTAPAPDGNFFRVMNCILGGQQQTSFPFQRGAGSAVITASFRADTPSSTQAYGLQLFTVGVLPDELIDIQVTYGGPGRASITVVVKNASGQPTPSSLPVDFTGVQRVLLRLSYNDGTHVVTPSFSIDGGKTFTVIPAPVGTVLTAGTQAATSVFGAVLVPNLPQGLVTSQTGLTFRSVQGAVSNQSVIVLSTTDKIPWTVSTRTTSGGGWLTATPTGTLSGPGVSPVTLSVVANATGLMPQDYYGSVTLTPTDGQHQPVTITVVLSVISAAATAPPTVSPTGIVFLTAPGSPKAQTFGISNLTSRPISFNGTASASPNWFDFSPKSGTANSGQTISITVTSGITNLSAGVYRGSIILSFSDATTQTVDLLLVVSPGTNATSLEATRAPGATCTASKLLPVFTTIGTGFNTPAAWPTSVAVQVVDDCGNSINNGSVTVTFSNGDSPLALFSVGNGNWTSTWVPTHPVAATFVVRADAQFLSLSGTVQVMGQISSNPNVPIVNASGVVSSGDYIGLPALGLLVSIFGTALADAPGVGAMSLPLPFLLGSTNVIMSGTELPVLYADDSQVNVLVPYTLDANTLHQLIVQRRNAISVPVQIPIFKAQPAILSAAGNGSGQGHIYKVDQLGNATLADARSPAAAGDVLVMYAVGLGPVTPTVKAGEAAPLSPLIATISPVAITIGGQSAQVIFAGLTPGYAGLYQVNLTMPSGVKTTDQAQVVVSVADTSSSSKISMAVK